MIYHVVFYFSKAFDIVYIDAIQKLDFYGIRGIAKDCFISVFYHLHGQTGRSTVRANGAQNSGLVNFVPKSLLPFVQISSIHRKTTAKDWHWFQRWLVKEMEHKFPFGILSLENQDYPLRFFLVPGNFRFERHNTKSRDPFTFQLDFPETFFKW